MGAREFAAEMRQTIEGIKAQGTAAIFCDNLIAYLNEVENSPEKEPSTAELERYKAELQQSVDSNKFLHESRIENFKAVIAAGQSAIKTILLINGGAALALLAFAGHLLTQSSALVPAFAASMLPFTFGALAAGLVSGGTYLAQWLFSSPRPGIQKLGSIVNLIAIVLGIFAYAMFVWGLLSTYGALTSSFAAVAVP